MQTLPEMRLRVKFVDGTEGVVDMQRFLASGTVLGTIFEPLRAPEEFGRATSGPIEENVAQRVL